MRLFFIVVLLTIFATNLEETIKQIIDYQQLKYKDYIQYKGGDKPVVDIKEKDKCFK